jgi:hypothetical protein
MAVNWAEGTAELHTPGGVVPLAFDDTLATAIQRLARVPVTVAGHAIDAPNHVLVERIAWDAGTEEPYLDQPGAEWRRITADDRRGAALGEDVPADGEITEAEWDAFTAALDEIIRDR